MNRKAELLRERQYRRAINPLRYARWHRGQDVLFRDMRQTEVAVGGNWSAKTYWLGMELAGAASGTHPVPGKYPIGALPIRVLGEPRIFRDVLQPIIRQYLPAGMLMGHTWVTSWGCDSLWRLSNGSRIEFISPDMDPDDLEGTTLAILAVDELAPQQLIEKCRMRLRDSRMFAHHGYGGKELYAFTPLQGTTYLHDRFISNVDSATCCVLNMPIWMNCRCLTPEDHGTDCRCNGGFKSRAEIVDYLSRCLASERRAREFGEWMFLSRRIFPYFKREVHVFDPQTMPGWTNGKPDHASLYVGCDPHDARPDFVQFWACLPGNRLYQLDELPSYHEGDFKGRFFETIGDYYRATIVSAKAINAVLRRLNLPVEAMVMDPFRGAMHVHDAGIKVVDDYNKALEADWPGGPKFLLAPPDKDDAYSIKAGERKINDRLYYNETIKPGMYFANRCSNTIRAVENSLRQDEGDDETKPIPEEAELKLKDGRDPIRYMLLCDPRFIPHRSQAERLRREAARRPPSTRVA